MRELLLEVEVLAENQGVQYVVIRNEADVRRRELPAD